MTTRQQPPWRNGKKRRPYTSATEIDNAVGKLRDLSNEIREIAPEIGFDDASVFALESKVVKTIREIFGEDSSEYEQYRTFKIQLGSTYKNFSKEYLQQEFRRSIPQAAALLWGLIDMLVYTKTRLFRTERDVRRAILDLQLHPRIADASIDLFQGGHYRNAVFDASLALLNFVKEKSGRHDLDGADLMRTVFSKNKPVLAFNDLKDQSELDEQEGLMHLFEGAVLALRNPRAHEMTPDSPEEALEFIALLSLLAKQVDGARRR
jgi:uncharacterized protein (TIGR02391 family)